MINMVKAAADICVEYPWTAGLLVQRRMEGFDRIHRAAPWPKAIGVGFKACLPFWLKGGLDDCLHHPVLAGWDAISRLHILSSLLQERLQSRILSTPCVATRSHSAIYVGWAICSNTSWSTLTGVF